MATSLTFLINATTRHAIFVNRFGAGQAAIAYQALNKARDEVLAQLASIDVTKASKARLRALYAEIEALSDEAFSTLEKKLTAEAKDFAIYEAEFSKRMFDKVSEASFSLPTAATINAAVFSNPLELSIGKEKLTIEQALKQFSASKKAELVATIKSGIISGKTNDDINRDIAFVANNIQRNHAKALTRTITNHVSTAARAATIKDNEDIVAGYKWVSTLDSRTTSTCQSLDGKVFPADSVTKPPLHWGCRSTIIPVLKDEYRIVTDAAVKRPSKGSSGTEQVAATSTYNSWLSQQSEEFQIEVLGSQRAKLFRDGGLSVSQFTDKQHRPLTLEELRKKEPMAFRKAGLAEEE